MESIQSVIAREIAGITNDVYRQVFLAHRTDPRHGLLGVHYPERGTPIDCWVVADLGEYRGHEYSLVYSPNSPEPGYTQRPWGFAYTESLLNCSSIWEESLNNLLHAWVDDPAMLFPHHRSDAPAEFDWYACDSAGYIAQMSSFTTGPVPDVVFDSRTGFGLLDGYFSLKYGSMHVAYDWWGQPDGFTNLARSKGLFIYDWGADGPYRQAGVPGQQLHLTEVNEHICNLISLIRFESIVFATAKDIHAKEFRGSLSAR